MRRVAYQGEPGSYSEEAVWRRFAGNDLEGHPCHSFEDAARALQSRDAALVLLPIENTLVGPIQEAVDVIHRHGLQVQDRFSIAIDHCLVGQPDGSLAHVKRVYSHPAALDQCRRFLHEHGYQSIPAEDTAGSVRAVKASGDPADAAVASRRAAALHGMKVLAEGIQDPGVNRTIFVVARIA